jgi:replicative DNA helicase
MPEVKPKPFEPARAVYTPPETALYGKQAIENFKNNASRGMSIGITDVKDYFAPLLPGQVCSIIAQTSQYKSGILHFIESQAAKQLVEEKRENEILVHVSVEECVEEQSFLEFARETGDDPGAIARGQVQDWTRLQAAVNVVSTIPIFRIGDSLARAEDMPNLYMSNMIRSIKHLREEMFPDWHPQIAGIFFDYLQAFPIDPEIKMASHEQQRRLQVRSDFYRIRQAAAYFKCPCWVAVQAKQVLDGARAPIMMPGIYDGEESSSIAQRSDRIITLWMPARTHIVGETINRGDTYFKVETNLLFVKVAKQRGGLPAGKMWKCRIDFNRNHIATEAMQ